VLDVGPFRMAGHIEFLATVLNRAAILLSGPRP
jgi:hypothetical protein